MIGTTDTAVVAVIFADVGKLHNTAEIDGFSEVEIRNLSGKLGGIGCILGSEGGKQDQYFRIDEMTDSMCYIPITMEGDFLLRMNFLSNSMQRLKYSILQKMNLQPCPNSLDCDGYEDPKTAVLFACDMDLKRIRNLKIGAEHKLLNLIILCFDFQADLLRNYYGDNAMIRTIDARKTAELFKIPYGGGAS